MSVAIEIAPAIPPSSHSLALELHGVSKAFGRHQALDRLSLRIAAAERVALLGPNGAGKTTLVRAISGRLPLDGGSIRLFGQRIDEPGTLNNLGVVPQEIAVYADLSARENLMAFGRLHGLDGQRLRHRVNWALEWIGLNDRQHQLVRTFSGGMKRRVNIACGVLHQPRLLLLDEPTVGVDPQSRQRIYEMLDDLHAHGTTLLLTTHHLDEAQSQCHRIVIVDRGSVVADGSLDQLLEQTLGRDRRVAMRIEKWQPGQLDGLEWDEPSGNWVASVEDIDEDLVALLGEIRALGGHITHLEVREPNLQELFLRLTGCELRE